MKCPKCHYERKPSDEAPDYECPSCGIIYAKYKPRSDSSEELGKTGERQNSAEFSSQAQKEAKKHNPIIVFLMAIGVFSAAYLYGKLSNSITESKEPVVPLVKTPTM